MFYNKVKRNVATVFLTFFLVGVFVLATTTTTASAAADAPLDYRSDRAIPDNTIKSNKNRIIIVYPLNGCGNLMSESVSDSAGLELQSSKRARYIALNELEKRVNEIRNQRLGTDLRYLSPDRTSRLAFNSNQQKTSIKLATQYLNAIQMEIAEVPTFMTEDEMVEISSTLPCVQMVEKDYLKKIQDPVEAESIITRDPIISNNNNNNNNNQRHLPSDDHYRIDESFTTSHAHTDSSRHINEQIDKEDEDDESSTYRNLQGSSFARRHGLTATSIAEGINSEGLMVPNDQLFPDQWHLQYTVPSNIRSQREWTEWTGSSGMVIAIIDSGCDLNHPDLASKKWVNNGEVCGDGIDNDKNGYVDDCYGWDWVDNDNSPFPQGSGHGTAAAGIIAAETNNLVGVAGICWDCRIMCLRFIQGVEGRVANQVAAIDYAAKMGAKISNNSYGGYGFSRLEYEVISRARSYGHLFVASAGNNNYNTDLPQYDHTPSIYNIDNILAVGASTKTGRKASFSNYGHSSVDLFAPGSRIVTTENGGGYAVVSGTSFAAPMGVGAAALMWSRFPLLSNTEIIEILTTSCRKSREFNGLAVCEGILDIEEAMKAAAEMARMKSGNSNAFVRKEAVASTPNNNTNDVNDKSSSTNTNNNNNMNTLASATSITSTGWLASFLSGFSRAVSYPAGLVNAAANSDEKIAKESSNKDKTSTMMITQQNGNNNNNNNNSRNNVAVEGVAVIEDSTMVKNQQSGSGLFHHRPDSHQRLPEGIQRLVSTLLTSPTNWFSSVLKNFVVE